MLKYSSIVLAVKSSNILYSIGKTKNIVNSLHDSYNLCTPTFYSPLPVYSNKCYGIFIYLFYFITKYLVSAEIIILCYSPRRKRNLTHPFYPFIVLQRYAYTITTLAVNVCRHFVTFLILAQVLRNS